MSVFRNVLWFITLVFIINQMSSVRSSKAYSSFETVDKTVWSKYEITVDNATLVQRLREMEILYPEPEEKGLILAWELESYLRHRNWGEIAKMLRTVTSTSFANVLSNPLGSSNRTPLQELLWSWYHTLLADWPRTNTEPYQTLLLSFLSRGMNPIVSCSFLHALRYRNYRALSIIVHSLFNVTDNKEQLKKDIQGCILSNDYTNIFYLASGTPTAATARLFFRGGQQHYHGHPEDKLYSSLAYENGVYYNATMYPIVRKYDLEQASPPLDLEILLPFIPSLSSDSETTVVGEASSPNIQGLLLEWDPKYHYTPLLNCCRNGRSSVLKYMLEHVLSSSAISVSSGTTHNDISIDSESKDQLYTLHNVYFTGGPSSYGMSCAHLAASQGYSEIFQILYRFYNRTNLFLFTDAFGRYPCDYVQSHGILYRSLFQQLIDYGVCYTDTYEPITVLPLSAYQCPGTTDNSTHVLQSTFTYFDTYAHVQNGWRLLSPIQLRNLSLSPNLFPLPAHHHASTNAQFIKDSVTFHRSCSVTELPANVLIDQDTLNRDYILKSHPFIIRGAYQNLEPHLGTEPLPSLTKSAILERFGHLTVDTGSLPYADAYGYGKDAKPMEFREFVDKYMGNSVTASLTTIDSTIINFGMDATGSVHSENVKDNEITILTAFHDGTAFHGPGSNITNPPYIFDGSILSEEIGQATIPEFGFPSIFQKEQADRQLIAGPPLSGAMLHFHDAAVNLLLVGVKLWIFIPPSEASFIDAHAHDFWTKYYLPMFVYSNFSSSPLNNVGYTNDTVPWHYIGLQSPGDLVFVPPHWGHAILNLADTVALAYE